MRGAGWTARTGRLLLPAVIAAATVAPAGLTGEGDPGLTTEQRIRILEGKVRMQAAMADAAAILDGSEDGKARRSASWALFWLNQWYGSAERVLDR